MRALRVSVVLLAILASRCGGSPTAPTPPVEPPSGSRTAVLIGAGDIGQCGSPGTAATGRLIASTLGDVILAGDIAYPSGTAANFRDCFDPFWGHARGRWHAVPGNHEYESPRAGPYFDYFGEAAGPPGLGYYRFVAGEWLVLMLNSEIPAGPSSDQYEFARALLESRLFRCQMAVWHRPLFTSGPDGPALHMRDMFKLLNDHKVDVVVNGHEHFYERFSRQDADGRPTENGIREFIVGTGGAELYPFVRMAPNSGARISTYGIIRLTLRPESYEWEFLDSAGGIGDSGFSACH